MQLAQARHFNYIICYRTIVIHDLCILGLGNLTWMCKHLPGTTNVCAFELSAQSFKKKSCNKSNQNMLCKLQYIGHNHTIHTSYISFTFSPLWIFASE